MSDDTPTGSRGADRDQSRVASHTHKAAALEQDVAELARLLGSYRFRVDDLSPIERTKCLLDALCRFSAAIERDNPEPWWPTQDRRVVKALKSSVTEALCARGPIPAPAAALALAELLAEAISNGVGLPDAYAALLHVIPVLKLRTETTYANGATGRAS